MQIDVDSVLKQSLIEISRLEEIKIKQGVAIEALQEQVKELQHELDMRDKLGGEKHEYSKDKPSHKQGSR